MKVLGKIRWAHQLILISCYKLNSLNKPKGPKWLKYNVCRNMNGTGAPEHLEGVWVLMHDTSERSQVRIHPHPFLQFILFLVFSFCKTVQ